MNVKGALSTCWMPHEANVAKQRKKNNSLVPLLSLLSESTFSFRCSIQNAFLHLLRRNVPLTLPLLCKIAARKAGMRYVQPKVANDWNRFVFHAVTNLPFPDNT